MRELIHDPLLVLKARTHLRMHHPTAEQQNTLRQGKIALALCVRCAVGIYHLSSIKVIQSTIEHGLFIA